MDAGSICVSLNAPFAPPLLAQTRLVLFTDERPFVPAEEAPRVLSACMRYARAHRVYLLSPRFLLDSRLCLVLLDPEGKPCGGQKALYPSLLYSEHIVAGEELALVSTDFGLCFLAVDADIHHPRVLRQAVGMGARLILASQYFPLYDVPEARLDYGARAGAVSAGVPIVGMSNLGGFAYDEGGRALQTLSAEYPVSVTVPIPSLPATLDAIRLGRALLLRHDAAAVRRPPEPRKGEGA